MLWSGVGIRPHPSLVWVQISRLTLYSWQHPATCPQTCRVSEGCGREVCGPLAGLTALYYVIKQTQDPLLTWCVQPLLHMAFCSVLHWQMSIMGSKCQRTSEQVYKVVFWENAESHLTNPVMHVKMCHLIVVLLPVKNKPKVQAATTTLYFLYVKAY